MAITSRYVQLSDWALLEYVYESKSISTTLAKPWKIDNAYEGKSVFINGNESLLVTNNVLDNSSNNMANRNIWTYNDIEAAVPIIKNDPKLALNSVSLGVSDIQYDTVKIHLIAGFNFEMSDGFIVNVNATETTGKPMDLANYTFLKGDSTQINFDPSPIMLGDRVYDRWVEFKVPSLKWIIDTAEPSDSFAKVYTTDSRGFVYNALINVTLFNIQTSKNIAGGNTEFKTSDDYAVSFLSEDTYGAFTAMIEEPTNADYFEMYGLWNGEFMEDYIIGLNSLGGNWSLIHSFEVFEQVGTETIKTTDSTYFQTTNFDQPLLYRPVILNSGIAFSFSIDYSLRLYNANDGTQIIRKSSITSFEPKKYGKQLEKINVNREFNPTKIYNKISGSGDINLSSDLFQQNLIGMQPTSVDKYIASYYSNTNISISSKSNELGNFNDVIYGQGKAYVFLNVFDNILRFKLYQKDSSNNTMPLDIPGSSDIKIAFVLNTKERVYVSRNTDTTLDISSGEMEFKIPSKTAKKILEQAHKSFYIVSSTTGSNETVLYRGNYDSDENRVEVELAMSKMEDAEINSKLGYLNGIKDQIEAEERRLTHLRNINIKTTTDEKEVVKLSKPQRTKIETNKVLAGYMNAIASDSNAIIREIPGVPLDTSSFPKTDLTPPSEEDEYVPPYTGGQFKPPTNP